MNTVCAFCAAALFAVPVCMLVVVYSSSALPEYVTFGAILGGGALVCGIVGVFLKKLRIRRLLSNINSFIDQNSTGAVSEVPELLSATTIAASSPDPLSQHKHLFSDVYAVEITARFPPRGAVQPLERALDLFQLGALFYPDNPVLALMHALYLWDNGKENHEAASAIVADLGSRSHELPFDLHRVYTQLSMLFMRDDDFEDRRHHVMLRTPPCLFFSFVRGFYR